MKKFCAIFLTCLMVFSCGLTASASQVPSDPTTTNPSAEQFPITTTPPPRRVPVKAESEPLVFHDTELPMPWPITRLCYEINVDCPFTFERQSYDPADPLDRGGWTAVEPIDLYQWSDGSWQNTQPRDIEPDQLCTRPFYLMEEGYRYRVVANFGGRTQNVRHEFLQVANYSLYDVYSGILNAGQTGIIQVELDEHVSDVCMIYRCQLNVASVEGMKFQPDSYATNINGDVIIGYTPTANTERSSYYKQSTADLIFPWDDVSDNSISVPLHHLLY